MTELPIMVSDDSVTVAGFASNIDLSVDVGARGTRGSIIFSGAGAPPAEPPGDDPIFNGINQFRVGDIYIDTAVQDMMPVYQYRDEPGGPTWLQIAGPTVGSGSVLSGPVSSTDNALAKWDGVDGLILQDSSISEDDSGNVTVGGGITAGDDIIISGDIELGSGGPTISTGTGTPEGVVTAPVGSMFTRSDGGAGTTLYVKESGAGNTGWVGK